MLSSVADDYLTATSPSFQASLYGKEADELEVQSVLNTLAEESEEDEFGNYGQTQVARKAVHQREKEDYLEGFQKNVIQAHGNPLEDEPDSVDRITGDFSPLETGSKVDASLLTKTAYKTGEEMERLAKGTPFEYYAKSYKTVASNANHMQRGIIRFLESIPDLVSSTFGWEKSSNNASYKNLKDTLFPVSQEESEQLLNLPGQLAGALYGPYKAFTTTMGMAKGKHAATRLATAWGTGVGLDFLLTSKETGNLSNLIQDKFNPTIGKDLLNYLKVREDASEWEAKYRGVKEGLLLGGAPGLAKSIFGALKLAKHGVGLSHLNKNKHLFGDYFSRVKSTEMPDSLDFVNYLIKDNMDRGSTALKSYFANEEGALKTGQAVGMITDALDKVSKMRKKVKKGSDAQDIEDFRDSIIDLERAAKDNDLDGVNKVYKEVETKGNKLLKSKELKDDVKEMVKGVKVLTKKENYQSYENLKKANPRLYETVSDIVNDSGAGSISVKNLEDGNFLHKINDVTDVGVVINNLKRGTSSLRKEADDVLNAAPKDRVKRDAYIKERYVNWVEKNGYDPEAVLSKFKDTEIAMEELYEKAVIITGLKNKASKDFTKELEDFFSLDTKTVDPKKMEEYRLKSASLAKKVEGLQELQRFENMLTREPARMLRFRREDVQEKIFGVAVDTKKGTSPEFARQKTMEKVVQMPGFKGTVEQNEAIKGILLRSSRNDMRKLAETMLRTTETLRNNYPGLSKEQIFNKMTQAMGASTTKSRMLELLKNFWYNNLLSGASWIVNNPLGNAISYGMYSAERLPLKLFYKGYYNVGTPLKNIKQFGGDLSKLGVEKRLKAQEYFDFVGLDQEKISFIKDNFAEFDSINKSLLQTIDASRSAHLSPWGRAKEAWKKGASVLDPYGQQFDFDEVITEEALKDILNENLPNVMQRYHLKNGVEELDKSVKAVLDHKVTKGFKGVIDAKWPTRILNSQDEFFKYNIYRQELNDIAIRKTNDDIRKVEGLDNMAAWKEKFEEIYHGNINKLENQNQALEVGREFTMTKRYRAAPRPDDIGSNPLEVSAGPVKWNIAETGEKIFDTIPALRFLSPFTRIQYNAVDFTSQRFPLINLLNSQWKEANRKGGLEAYMARSKVATTSALALTALTAFEISGRGPDNIRAKKQWLADGKTAYGLKVPLTDIWVPLTKLGPIGEVIGLWADFKEGAIAYYNAYGVHDQDTENIGFALAFAIGNFLTPDFITDSIYDLSQLSKDAAGGERFVRGLGSAVGSAAIPLSGLNRALRKFTDLTKREKVVSDRNGIDTMRTVLNDWIDMIPGFSRLLPPMRNILGEEMHYGGTPIDFVGDHISPEAIKHWAMRGAKGLAAATGLAAGKDEPIYEKFKELGMAEGPIFYKDPNKLLIGRIKNRITVPLPDGTKDFISLNPEQYDDLVKKSTGQDPSLGLPTLKKALNDLVTEKDFSELPPQLQTLMIKDVVRSYREVGKSFFMMDNEAFQNEQQNIYLEMAGL